MRTDSDEDEGLNRIMWPLSGENKGSGNYHVKKHKKRLETAVVKSFTVVVEEKTVVTSDDSSFNLPCMSLLPHCNAVMTTLHFPA